MTATTGTIIIRQQPAMNRRDLYLLKHMIFMFSMFIIGWTPIFSLEAIDYTYALARLYDRFVTMQSRFKTIYKGHNFTMLLNSQTEKQFLF
ncbi:unnamed protein product [Adineta steineri]|uniref:Uncharacterized protein n=1 Tax=Adineta steineri TaxID=433720 RepID=A0A820KBF7_9BILA|nr:unnamed protein product [Adineta steineri]